MASASVQVPVDISSLSTKNKSNTAAKTPTLAAIARSIESL